MVRWLDAGCRTTAATEAADVGAITTGAVGMGDCDCCVSCCDSSCVDPAPFVSLGALWVAEIELVLFSWAVGTSVRTAALRALAVPPGSSKHHRVNRVKTCVSMLREYVSKCATMMTQACASKVISNVCVLHALERRRQTKHRDKRSPSRNTHPAHSECGAKRIELRCPMSQHHFLSKNIRNGHVDRLR